MRNAIKNKLHGHRVFRNGLGKPSGIIHTRLTGLSTPDVDIEFGMTLHYPIWCLYMFNKDYFDIDRLATEETSVAGLSACLTVYTGVDGHEESILGYA